MSPRICCPQHLSVIALPNSTTVPPWFCLVCCLLRGHHLPLGQKPWQGSASCCPSSASLGKMKLWSGTVPSAADGHKHVVTPNAAPCPSQGSSVGVPGFVWDVTFCPPICAGSALTELPQLRISCVVFCLPESQYLHP